MAFATIHYSSRSLRKASSFNVVFPEEPAAPRPWAAFYLLHGLSDDNTIWTRRTSIERYVAGWPMVVVMPDGGRGFYTNAVEGDAYEDDLIKDVMGLVERTFPVKPDRSARAIGGLSMGGYGAIKLGLKHPEMFASVHSHSVLQAFCELISSGPRSTIPSSTGSSASHPQTVQRIRSPSSNRSITAVSPSCGSIAAPRISCSTRTGPSTPTWSRSTSRTSTRSFPAPTSGATGTNTSRRPSHSTPGTCTSSGSAASRGGGRVA